MIFRTGLRASLLLLSIFLFFSGSSLADTTVGGRISADTTWTLTGSPYIVTSTVQVYGTATTPVTLTIEPGVVVKFASGAGLTIGDSANQGSLIAQGTTGSRITFTRSGASGTWPGITFNDKTVDATAIIEYADVQYSAGVTMNSASPTIRNSAVTDVTGYISLSTSNPTLDTVTITNNGSYGIYLSSSSPVITGGSLTNTNTAGHGIYGSGSPVISNYNVSIVNTAGKYGAYLSSASSTLSITNSTIANGLYIGSTGITPAITGNTFTNADNSPVHAGANIIGWIMSNNTINGMSSAGKIEVIGEQVSQDAQWNKWAAPYVVVSGTVSVYKNTSSAATLTIDPGVTIKFASGSGLQVGSGTNMGALVAHGNADNRITLTRSGTSGTWSTLVFNDGTVDAATILEYVDIQYSSGVTMSYASPAIRNASMINLSGYVNLSSSSPTLDTITIANNSSYGIYLSSSSPVITGGSLTNSSTTGHGIYGSGSPVISNYNVSIVNTANYYGLYLSSTTSTLSLANSSIANGIYINSTGITPTITGNTFTNVDNSPIHTGAKIISQVLGNNTINGMTSAGKIEVVGEQISQDARWMKWSAPYVVTTGTVSVYKDATTASTLTIDPGVIIKFASGAGLTIGSSTNQGSLIAQGTSGNRVTFTRSGTSGTWAGITFNDKTVDATAIIEYADVQYSTGITMNYASPTIRNSTITDVTGYGLNLSSSNPTIDTVTIANNGTYGINLSSSSPIITGGSLTNTSATGHGIYGSGSPVISNYNVSIVNTAGKYGLYLSSASSTLSITNSTIANGLYLGSTNITPAVTGNTFTNVDNAPIHAGANIISQILSNNTINGMTSAGKIEVVGEQVSQDAQWNKWAAPYVVVSGTVSVYKNTSSAATLTIDPGVIIKFASSSGLTVGDGTNQGSLVAQGTTANRITFTRSGASGTWYGITFNDKTVDATALIEYADIQYSTGVTMTSAAPVIRNSTITEITGYISLNSSNPTLDAVMVMNNGAYGIYLSSSSPVITNGSLTNTNATGHGIYGSGSPVISNYNVSIVNTAGKYGTYLSGTTSALSITNSTIANGLYFGSTGFIPAITGNTFTNVDNSPIHSGANIIAQLMNNNTVSGMTSSGKIEVVGEQVNQDAQWQKWAAPYVVVSGTVNVYKDTVTAATLTIDPGVIVKFASGTSLQAGSGSNRGVLEAQGTADNKITLTSNQAAPAPGNWNGVTLSGAASGLSVIEYVTIEYAGSGANYNNANLTIYSAAPIIRNSLIRNSAGSGVYFTGASSYPVIMDSEITGNKWGIYSGSSNPYITNTKIYSNPTFGVYNSTTTVDVDARDNWWGAASGPMHASNPSGTGDKVSDKVLYNPWLGQAPSIFSITEAKALPTSLNPIGDYIAFSAKATSSANWSISIKDGSNNLVKGFSGTGTVINQKWYGEDGQDVKVADGIYYYDIQATDVATGATASAPTGFLLVSRQLPMAILDPPSDNQMFTGGTVVNVTGTASDSTDFKNYTLDYGTGENPTSWTVLKNAITTPVTSALIHAWDTSALTGNVYTLRLRVTDNPGNIATETSRVRLLWIQNVAVSEGYISPNADAIKDTTTISATFTYQSNWTITIKNGSGTAVRTITGTANSVSQAWDGKDDSGQTVPDGVYTYQIDALSPETSIAAAPKTGTVTVDSTLPTAQITSPTENAVLLNSVPVLGTATDTNLDSYRVEHGPAGGAGPWTLLVSSSYPVAGGTLATWMTNDATNNILLQNGGYVLRLTTTDRAGNISITAVPVSLDNLILSNIGASSHTLNTLNSEISAVSFTTNMPGSVTLKIVPEIQGPTGTPVYQASQNFATAGTYSFNWDGKNNAGMVVPDEAYLYILEASEGTRTDSYSPTQPTGTGTITCSQSSNFDAISNTPMIVTYTPGQPMRLNISISWGSQNFNILNAFPDVAGSHTYSWDVRNPAGNPLDSGAQSSCSVASLIRENHIITSGDSPKVNSLKTDPYVMAFAYGQFTRIKYALSRDSNVTVNLVSPTGATTITLVNNQFQSAGPQETDWYGTDPADITGKKALVSEAGDYIVSIQAVNPVTGTSSIVRGNLRIGY